MHSRSAVEWCGLPEQTAPAGSRRTWLSGAIASVPGVDVLLIGPSDLSIELGVPLDYQCDIYQRALDKIAATAAKHGIAAGMAGVSRQRDRRDPLRGMRPIGIQAVLLREVLLA